MRFQTIPSLRYFAWLPLLMAWLGACAPQGEKASDYSSIVYGGSAWYGHAPVWAGIEKGFFDEAGLRVEVKTFTSSSDRLLAVASDSAQFAGLGEVAMLSFMSQGNRDFYWVGNQDIAPGFEGIVAQKGVKTLRELKGKKLAVQFASSVDITVFDLLKAAGLDPLRDVERINMRATEMLPAFANGLVDAAAVWEPHFSELKKVEGAHVLGLDTDTRIYKQFGTMTGPDVLVVSRRFADQAPERFKTFLRAYFKSLDWVAANPGEAGEIATKYTGQESAEVAANLKRIVWLPLAKQPEILSDKGLFRQVDMVLDILVDEMEAFETKPPYREWVRTDLLPAP